MKGPRKHPQSKSSRAKLSLPVGRIHSMLVKGGYAKRMGATAAVSLAAIMENMVRRVLNGAMVNMQAEKKFRINPRHILYGVHAEKELKDMFGKIAILKAGTVPTPKPLDSKRKK